MARRRVLLPLALIGAFSAVPARAADPVATPVFYIVYQHVTDAARFAAYVRAVTPAIERRGGRLLAAHAPEYTEGVAPYSRVAVFEYPSREVAAAFVNSAEYARIRALRVGAAEWMSAIVPALPAGNQ